MRKIKYFCPVHPEVLLHEEVLAINIGKKAVSLFGKFKALTPGAAYFPVGIAEGPYECDKCKKSYHKWECSKK